MFNHENDLVSTHPLLGGIQHKFKFKNGYGASVVCGPYTYGGKKGLFELAVLDKDDYICYTTEITNSVLGYLTNEDVDILLTRISELTEKEEAQINITYTDGPPKQKAFLNRDDIIQRENEMNSFELFKQEFKELLIDLYIELEARITYAFQEECSSFDDNNRSLEYRAGVENLYHRLNVIYKMED